MAKYQIVIADADLAHAREIARNVEHNVKIHGEQHRAKITAMVEARHPNGPRPKGTVHDEVETDCPDGLPNCRNCGDPAYADDCQAKGHCPDCGTTHGLAPDAVVAANGYELKAL